MRSITSADIQNADLRHFARFTGLDAAAPGRCSKLLLFQLCATLIDQALPWDPPKIVAEIKALEGVGPPLGTRPATPFKHPPLKGLWKKHYFTAGRAAFAKNIRTGLGRRGLMALIRKHHNPATEHLGPKEISRRIADEVVHGTYARLKATEALTGEWLIFARHDGANYYLTVASHRESDIDIYQRIQASCFAEFPFLDPPPSA